ncbi:hypothetical protein [Jatrophihabitans sp.]|uniref:hypothetical protein n=1 Tax=Jatrophihabitans sp. TaxID=1932789 RepID=UPI002C61758A|nr:hypothetical protein [Jatrophihabitans sp.]
MTFAAARLATGRGPDSATVVLRPVPSALPPGTAVRELLAASREFFGDQVPLDDPTGLGGSESKAELVARTRALCAGRGRPVALGFGAAGGVQYLGAALEHGRFDATAGSLFGEALATWLQGGQPGRPVPGPTTDSAVISERSVGAWRRALDVAGGIARCDPPASAPCGAYLRLPRQAGRSAEPAGGRRDGLAPVLDAIGQAFGRGRRDGPRLVGVTGSNRQYPDLASFAGMAAQPGPIVLDDAVTSPASPRRGRYDLLHRRLLIALRSARWCPNCLDAEFGRFDATLCGFFTETLIVNDTRRLDLELADVLDRVPARQPIELADWPFHPGGSAFALATDTAGDSILALRSSSQALSGIEPADFLMAVRANLTCD